MRKNIYLFALLIIIASSCEMLHNNNQPKDPEIEYSSVYPLSGEWWVQYRFDDGAGNIDDHYGVGYVPLYTANTAADDGAEFWISDGGNFEGGNFWSYSVKCPCNVDVTSFSGADLVSTADWEGDPYNIIVQITNGRVIVDGGLSTSGVVTDSIFFEVEFEDDPGTIYQCSGIRRTGFLEDEH